MKTTVLVHCYTCGANLGISKSGNGIRLPLRSEIRKEAHRHGWHLGRQCICPDCKILYSDCDKCSGCIRWRNKSMETPTCKLDGELALADDFCENYEPRKADS